MTDPRTPFDPLGPAAHNIILEKIRFKVGRTFPRDITVRVGDPAGFLADHLTVTLTAEVYAERLPQRQVAVQLTDPRWATWWDHLKATGKETWWGWWWIGHLRKPRTVDATVTGTIRIDSMWTYPDSPLLREGLGAPVYKASTGYHGGFPRWDTLGPHL